jgi:hypothetical protein
MRTTKAYLAGLGTTGVLIASMLAVMVIGTGVVGFDGQEFRDGGGPLERVVVDHEDHGARAERRPGRTAGSPPPLVAGAGRPRLASRRLLAGRSPGAAERPAKRRAERRRSNLHGGAAVTADVLGGGARAGGGTGRVPGGRPGGRPTGGGAMPRSSPPPVPALSGGLPAPLDAAQDQVERALPPGLRR